MAPLHQTWNSNQSHSERNSHLKVTWDERKHIKATNMTCSQGSCILRGKKIKYISSKHSNQKAEVQSIPTHNFVPGQKAEMQELMKESTFCLETFDYRKRGQHPARCGFNLPPLNLLVPSAPSGPFTLQTGNVAAFWSGREMLVQLHPHRVRSS